MSTYRVDKTHIDALLTAANSHGYTPFYVHHNGIRYSPSGLGVEELGNALVDLNNRAVNTRYREDLAPAPYTFTRLNMDALPPLTILKLIAGLRYQCAEFDGWDQTLGAAFLDRLEHMAIDLLPGYDQAPWTLDPERYAEELHAHQRPPAWTTT